MVLAVPRIVDGNYATTSGADLPDELNFARPTHPEPSRRLAVDRDGNRPVFERRTRQIGPLELSNETPGLP
jgi:hypothetical protein